MNKRGVASKVLQAFGEEHPGALRRMQLFLPELDEEGLADVVIYVRNTCGDCHVGDSYCQCWNDE